MAFKALSSLTQMVKREEETLKEEMKQEEEKVKEFENETTASMARFGFDIDMSGWTKQRRLLSMIITDRKFEMALAALVLLSLSMVIVETDAEARGDDSPGWIEPTENILLLIYVVEMVSRTYVLRKHLFDSSLNILDFTVVVMDTMFFFIGIVVNQLPKVAFFRILRLMRLSRAFHILASQQQLFIMMESLLSSLKTTLCGCVFLAVGLIVFGIVAVQFLAPLPVEFCATCSRGPTAFISVYHSMCTLIQTVIVGDEWGDLFLPYMDLYPETLFFIVPVFVVINLALMNLIMAVIVDSAAQARKQNSFMQEREKASMFHRASVKLRGLCEEMDKDKSGSISLPELLGGYRENFEFRQTLCEMDLDADDMTTVFSILDEDGSGTVAYGEFVEQLYKMKENNTNTMLVFIKHYVTELRRNVLEDTNLLKNQVCGDIAEVRKAIGEEASMLKDHVMGDITACRELLASMIKNNDTMILDALSESHKRIDAVVQKSTTEEARSSTTRVDEQHCTDDAVTVLPGLAGLPVTSNLNSGTAGHLATEKMAAFLDDLKCNCENSARLLSTFHGLLACSVPKAAQSELQTGECPGLPMSKPAVSTSLLQAGLTPHSSSLDIADGNGCLTPHVAASGKVDEYLHQSERMATVQQFARVANVQRNCTSEVEAILDARLNVADTSDKGTLGHDASSSCAAVTEEKTDGTMQTASGPCYLNFTFEDITPRLGLELCWVEDGLPYIGNVVPDSPANLCGVLPGDHLVKCNQIPIAGMDRKEVLQLLQLRPLQLLMSRPDMRDNISFTTALSANEKG